VGMTDSLDWLFSGRYWKDINQMHQKCLMWMTSKARDPRETFSAEMDYLEAPHSPNAEQIPYADYVVQNNLVIYPAPKQGGLGEEENIVAIETDRELFLQLLRKVEALKEVDMEVLIIRYYADKKVKNKDLVNQLGRSARGIDGARAKLKVCYKEIRESIG
jgi:hypothetical protein